MSKYKDMIMHIRDNIKTCLFDLDGTLVDSMWMWGEIDREYLARYGLSCPDGIEREIEGMSFTETATYFKNKFELPDEVDKIKSDWEEMSVDKYKYEVKLKKGVYDFLNYIKRNGIKTGIATSNGRRMVDAVLESLNIKKYFDTVVTGCDVKKGKPSPDIYLRAADILSSDVKSCLVFEDVPAGIMAGKAAGMRVYAVEDDFSLHLKEEKIRLADGYIVDYRDII